MALSMHGILVPSFSIQQSTVTDIVNIAFSHRMVTSNKDDKLDVVGMVGWPPGRSFSVFAGFFTTVSPSGNVDCQEGLSSMAPMPPPPGFPPRATATCQQCEDSDMDGWLFMMLPSHVTLPLGCLDRG